MILSGELVGEGAVLVVEGTGVEDTAVFVGRVRVVEMAVVTVGSALLEKLVHGLMIPRVEEHNLSGGGSAGESTRPGGRASMGIVENLLEATPARATMPRFKNLMM